MATGSPDYWMSSNYFLGALMTEIKAAILDNSEILAKLDVLDGTMNGVITLDQLNDEACQILAAVLGIATNGFDDGDLLAKLDNLDGKADGKLDFSKVGGVFVDSEGETLVTKLQLSIERLIESVNELIGVHADTTAMIDFSSEEWGGNVGANWVSVSSYSANRNMLRINNTGGQNLWVSRNGGAGISGYIYTGSSSTFYDADGVWLYVPSGTCTFTAREEWAT